MFARDQLRQPVSLQAIGEDARYRRGAADEDETGCRRMKHVPIKVKAVVPGFQRLPGIVCDETEIGMAGPSTVFGDAIGLAIKLFSESESDNRVLIMLTDGNDTGSTVPPIDAAKVAAASDIRIYSIAIGDPTTVGEDALDMETIERVSEIASGRSFQALDREAMRQAYITIGELEPELYESISFRPKQSMHWVPLLIITLLYLLYHGYNQLSAFRAGRMNRAP